MKVENKVYMFIASVALLLAVSLLLVGNGILMESYGAMMLGVLLFVLALFVPLAAFTALVAKRLDALAETGEDIAALDVLESETIKFESVQDSAR